MSNNSSSINVNNLRDCVELLKLIVFGYGGMILGLFGIVGNIITILVLLSPSMRTISTNIYLTALSGSNIFLLLIFTVFGSVKFLFKYPSFMKRQSSLEDLLERLPSTPILHALLFSVIYLTIAISVDRLISVKYPLRSKQILTQRRTLRIIFSIYIFSIIYSIPFWLEWQYAPPWKRYVDTKINIKIRKYIRLYIYLPVAHLIPFITLTCTHITIIKNLIAKNRRKRSLGLITNLTRQTDYYIILMLVIVIIVFILCKLLLSIVIVWYATDPYDKNSLIYRLFMLLGEFLFMLNASTNFLIHWLFGEKFRRILLEFILHIITNFNRQRNLPRRLSEKQRNSQAPEEKQIILLRNSLTTNHLKKFNDLNNISNQNRIQKSSINQQELCLLMTESEEITGINGHISFKSDQNHHLHRFKNGERIC